MTDVPDRPRRMGFWRRVRHHGGELALTAPSFVWMTFFFVVPTAIVFLLTFRPTAVDGGIGAGWTLETWKTISNPNYPSIVWRTIWLSVVATALSIGIALPCACAMARTSAKWRSVLVGLVILPFWTSFLIRVFAWKNLLHPQAALARALHTDLGSAGFLALQDVLLFALLFGAGCLALFLVNSLRMSSTARGKAACAALLVATVVGALWCAKLWIGFTSARIGAGVCSIVPPRAPLLYNSLAILVVMVYTYLPFAILPLYAAAEKFDFALLEAALDLGARPVRAFVNVFVPGVKAGIYSAVLMVLIPALGSYVIPDMVGGPDAEMIGSKIYQRAIPDRNLPHASALSALLMLGVLVPPGIAWLVFRRRHIGATETDVVRSIGSSNLGNLGGRRKREGGAA